MSARRKNIMLGTAGHVDHGKTALVKLLTGCDTDRLKEEKQRGLTIELGFAPCRLANERIVGVVDVPGHVDFIRNMVAGAHGIDVVILVVAADDGVMPQTREHLDILTLMGLRHGLVALTKTDLVDAAMLDLAKEDVRRFLGGTFLEQAPICPISNVTGEGFEAFFEALNAAQAACEAHPCAGPFRVWIDDVFTIHGFGTVLTGIPSNGSVRAGDPVELLPQGRTVRVRQLQVYGETAEEGRAGECVALNMADVDHTGIHRGMVAAQPDSISPVRLFEAELQLLPTMKGAVRDYIEVHLHTGTAATLCRVAFLERDSMGAGDRQMVQLRCHDPLPVMPGDRFVIRGTSPGSGGRGVTTLGGGRILDTSDRRLRRKREWTLQQLRGRLAVLDDPLAWVECLLREAVTGIRGDALRRSSHCREDELRTLLSQLRQSGRATEFSPGLWVHQETIKELSARLLAAIRGFHAANPERSGLEEKELFKRLAQKNEPNMGMKVPESRGVHQGPVPIAGPDGAASNHPRAVASIPSELLRVALEEALAGGDICRAGTVYAAVGFKSPAESVNADPLAVAVLQEFREAGAAPPSSAVLAEQLSSTTAEVETIIRRLTDQGELVRIEAVHYLHRSAVERAQRIVLDLFRKTSSFTTMDFRDALGVSRKFAVPLLDYLDRTRFTVRTGNQRTPGAEARARLG